jgi:hypothetical protein
VSFRPEAGEALERRFRIFVVEYQFFCGAESEPAWIEWIRHCGDTS